MKLFYLFSYKNYLICRNHPDDSFSVYFVIDRNKDKINILHKHDAVYVVTPNNKHGKFINWSEAKRYIDRSQKGTPSVTIQRTSKQQ